MGGNESGNKKTCTCTRRTTWHSKASTWSQTQNWAFNWAHHCTALLSLLIIAEYFMFKPRLPLLHILIKMGRRTKLCNQYCSLVFVSLYTLSVYIMVGSLGLPALIHTAGTSQHCACFTPPRSPPVLDLHDLRERDGGLLLFSELYFSSATKTLQWGSLRISKQLKVGPCRRMQISPTVLMWWSFCSCNGSRVYIT